MSEPPTGTYRLQLRPEFGFAEAAALAGYLAGLGVSHVYLSPILQAAPGSAHGYDVVDHSRISAELGGEDGFRAMAARFHEHGLKIVVDVVPNHMAVPAPEPLNRQLWSVLRAGRESPDARWFDVDWEHGGGRILLPVLGDPDDRPVPDGDVLRYHDHVFPLPAEHHRPVYWREGPNYRRFFEISTLIGLRPEDPEVFAATHAVPLRLIEEGLVHGLRVDHPDGLADPRGYLRVLAGRAGVWTVVEKILTGDERLPADWPCAGTTGYDALGEIGGLFLDPAGERPLTELYTDFTGGPADFAEVEHAARREAARHGLRPETARLHRALCRLLPSHDERALETVLDELLYAVPVYRAYVVPGEEPPAESLKILSASAEQAADRLPAELRPVLDTVLGIVTGRLGDGPLAREFVVRFQQTTAPLMAKGVEDTAFYRWSRLASLNEVGGDPTRFAVSRSDFHAYCARQARDRPAAMTTLSTHDTKRQEDVRAALAVLAELPAEWSAAVTAWSRRARELTPARPEPDLEYLLWQTLAGAWPLPADRLAEYARKAMREAKTRTSWTDPDPEYERAVLEFAAVAASDPEITAGLAAFAELVAPHARVNALGQKLVQLAMPGVPDVYQGCELTGRALVDPDNRRPVDYEHRRQLLARLDAGEPPRTLDEEKLLVTVRTMRLRRRRPDWFRADHEPVPARGASSHVVAFRRGGAIAVATRLPVGLARIGGWGDTVLDLAGPAWRDLLTGRLHLRPRPADILDRLPVALLVEERG
ncbi:malto-oligosyltrehalose synthase [Actinomadura craniellae]|uniref:Malto-oligosyltrehalose synthase n=1 Tax=Actinomadura craniellae TaxID=2231787 RepID=A0A365GZA2_9ACTN|nr:malto-oligosyltrehalose synthase [Actinomadura craniellae]RAY12151.1 malto-oligosyltrehalose synthase [Actinomadura craniellae]